MRRAFDANVKLDVARMVRDQGISVPEVCRTMSVGRTAVQRWVRQLDASRQGEPVRGAMALTAQMQRIRQLEEENRRLRSDNDVLKKATAFFARELKRSTEWFTSCKRRPSRCPNRVDCSGSVGLAITRRSGL